jgi:membrane protease YdiL (CAAX protease family)
MTPDGVTVGTAVLELLDTAVLVITLAAVGRVGLPAPPARARVAAWAVAAPLLTLLLAVNLAYAAALNEFLRVNPDRGPGLSAATFFLICVQPAVVEELFFRYAALGVLCRAAGLRAAVVVSSAMFALAHVYAPLSLPYLFLLGVALGYARVWGGLPLAVLAHFAHNLAVLLLEGVR